MDSVTEIVARQYSAWVYPKPIPDMAQAVAQGYYEYGTPQLSLPLLWPERRSLDGLKVLIAGCGTNQAAYYAMVLPGAEVTAIDISLSSLQHTQFLKEKHGLANLTLKQMSLLDVAELGSTYDFIVSTGVLHHLPDPDAGLRALREVLAPDGVMNLMVYGKYHRAGVYMLQEVFRRLGCGQTPEDVELVKTTLRSMPPGHAIHLYASAAEDLAYDSGIVDTFLHPQDRAYTVSEVLEFARRNGLAFWDWTDRKEYSPIALIPAAHPILSRILALPQEEQWAVTELLTQKQGTHRFILCHPQRLAAPRPQFEGHDWINQVPVLRPGLAVLEQGDISTDKPARLKRDWHEFLLNRIGMALMQHVDGVRTIAQIIELARQTVPELSVTQAGEFFRGMQDWGHVMFWLASMDRPRKPQAAPQGVGDIPAERLSHIEQLLGQGDFSQAEQVARSELASWPQHPRLQHYLGLALFQQKRFQEALPHYTQAAAQLPEDANVQNQLALTLKYLKRHRDAMAVWQKILGLILATDALPVYVNIAANLNDAEAFDEALDWVEKGLAMSPQQQELRITKAIALLGKERVTEAEELVQGLLAEGYRNDLVLNAWGRIRLKEGDPEVALEYLQAAERLGGSNAPTCIARGQALADLGRFDEATQAFEEALRYDPTRADAWASIAHAHKMTQADQAWWERSEAFLAHKDLKPDQAMSLHYAMGKFCNDTQDYDRAFVHYQQANQLKRETWKESRYDRQHQEKLVQALTHRYSAELFEAWKSLANPSLRPLLIVGMPRSGTSLTEQILASHPNIYGAGELRFWPRFAARHQRTVLDGTFNAHWLHEAAQTCLNHLAQKNQEAARVVDKMPSNFLWAGLIHLIFPNARILHTTRNPVDNGLSIYFQDFSKDHGYANDLEDIAHYYRQYHHLMAHWRQVIPADRFLELPYEALIEDQEGWSRKIIEFIGLEWDERCLDFHKTERKVGTASNWQARQPIYKTSKERWRNYEKYVGPLLPLLELYDPARGQV